MTSNSSRINTVMLCLHVLQQHFCHIERCLELNEVFEAGSLRDSSLDHSIDQAPKKRNSTRQRFLEVLHHLLTRLNIFDPSVSKKNRTMRQYF
mmetsp:Transcript_25668/g.37940  ORF Transcript_25668/g.37940 Transcript_25668/m.37940 type:complete len:93 (+) Transcript_25668:403-681(+)